MNESPSRIEQNLNERRTQLALESVLQIKNSPDYVAVIKDINLLKNDLGKLYSHEDLERVYVEFTRTGKPFRFCHMLLTPYYLSFQKNEELKGQIAPPKEWPAIIPIDIILNAIQSGCKSKKYAVNH